MTTLLLIRHAEQELGPDVLPGRTPGVRLSPAGREAAAALAEPLAGLPIAAIYTSPIDRARETAAPLAARLGLPPRIADGLTELDFGEWSGRTFAELDRLPAWRRWNAHRSTSCTPAGETMAAAQTRIVSELLALRERHPEDLIAAFSHGDPIRAAIAWFLGVPLDLFQRIEIGLASVSAVALTDSGPRVLYVNRSGGLGPP